MKKARSKDARPYCKKISRLKYLEGVKGRLVDDIEPYLVVIKQTVLKSGKKIGFWSLARMIFPVIEAVGSCIYKERQFRLLERIGVPCPALVWKMYRHSLIHGDQPRFLIYRKQRIDWEVRIFEGAHAIKKGVIAIDLGKCYRDFLGFLDREILKSGTKSIWVEDGIVFNKKISKQLKDEFRALKTIS